MEILIPILICPILVTRILQKVLLIDLHFADQAVILILGIILATLVLLNLRQQVIIIILESYFMYCALIHFLFLNPIEGLQN